MSLTRSFLRGMGLTDEQISAIIEEHVSTTDALKEQRDEYKKTADLLPNIQKELDDLKEKGDGGWQKKYEDEHSAFEAFKTAQDEAKKLEAKVSAYKGLLSEIGIGEKFIDLVTTASAKDIEKIEIGDDGKIKGHDVLAESIKTSYAYCIKEESKGGAGTHNPPNNNGGNFDSLSLSEKMAYANEHPDSPEVKTWLNK